MKTTLIHCKNAVAVKINDMPRSLECEELSAKANEFCSCFASSDYTDAIEKAVSLSGGNPIFVFGSLYLASAIRPYLKNFFKN